MADGFAFDEDAPSAFDDKEFEDPEADAQMAANAAEATFKAMTAQPSKLPTLKPEEFNLSSDLDYMDDVVRRMDVANYYREVLANPLFENADPDPQLVEDEVRQFCIGRLQVLMGIRTDSRPLGPSKPFPLDDKAIEAIKALIPYTQDLLNLTETFAPMELEALKSLAAVALKHQGRLAPSKPVTRRAPTPGPKPVQAAPVAQPAPALPQPRPKPIPVPVAPPPPPPAPVLTRPTMARRGTRPAVNPPAALKAPVAVQATTTRQVTADNGQTVDHTTTVQRIQRPAGMVPFPSDNRSMMVATANLAGTQLSVSDHEDKHTQSS